jgi:hypothetical protein
MSELCMSNMLRPQQVVLSGTRFHHVSFCFNARQSFERTCGPQSPGLSSPDFFLWGCLEERVYKYKPHNVEAVKDKIPLVLANVESDVLQQMVDNIEHNVQLCL